MDLQATYLCHDFQDLLVSHNICSLASDYCFFSPKAQKCQSEDYDLTLVKYETMSQKFCLENTLRLSKIIKILKIAYWDIQ